MGRGGKDKKSTVKEFSPEQNRIRFNEREPIEYRNEAGLLHREDGPARIHPSGTEEWYKDGVLHREDGPAVISYYADRGVVQEYFINGRLHREDGPAVVFVMGDELVHEFWENGIRVRENEVSFIGSRKEKIKVQAKRITDLAKEEKTRKRRLREASS